jgi:sigma-B regulation protein RsbU (phosphoserine phosphatase)
MTSANPVLTSSEILGAVFDYAARIGSEREVDELLRLNADFARDLVGADRCSLWMVDPTTGELWTKVAHEVQPIRIPAGSGVVGASIEKVEAVVVNDAENDPRLFRRIDDQSGYRTKQVLCVPLITNAKVIGALQLLNKSDGFTETDVSLLGLLAHFSASAIETDRLRRETENARLLDRELQLARDVQNRLLPERLVQARGLACAGHCRPARSIGGDYYDLLELKNDQLAVTVGDVSGKGIPAAVMMASIQMLLRNSLKQLASPNLAQLIVDLNATLYSSSTAERYSTLFCGVISGDRTTLSYVNAGHIAPILVHGDGSIDRLVGNGIPVGLLPKASYELMTAALLPGDTLVAISDGILEACNRSGEFWNEDSIIPLLAESSSLPVSAIPGLLCDAVDRFAEGAEQYDDMTVVAVRFV